MQIGNDSPAIEVKNVSYRYGNSTVLENINFNVKKGEYLGIIGPNGGGKTTLLKIILGLLKPDTGTVKLFGQDLINFKNRSFIGYVPQKASAAENLFPATVEEIVKSGRTRGIGLFKRFKRKDSEAVQKAMKITGIDKLKNRLIGRLSGGERQKVLIARALACEPQILILDEPTVAIDTPSQEKFYSFLDHLNQELGLTVIFVSHDIAAVAKKVSTVLCMNRVMVCHGSAAQFIKEEYMEKLYGKKVHLILHGTHEADA